jgi:hypothetical protein
MADRPVDGRDLLVLLARWLTRLDFGDRAVQRNGLADMLGRSAERSSTIRATVPDVTRSLHVRLDEASAAALEIVRAGGLTDSEAVRTALREAAARRRVRSAIRDEVRSLAADESDREEMRFIREQLSDLAPPVTD